MRIATALSALLLLAAATLARPYVNRSSTRGEEEAYIGYDALVHNRTAEAASWYRDATTMSPDTASYWYNLGIAYARSNDFARALACYQRAATLDGRRADYQNAYEKLKEYLAQLHEAGVAPPATTRQ